MANSLNKEIAVAWEDATQAFEDNEVTSKMVSKYNTDAQRMERANDRIWRPKPYIMNTESDWDLTTKFGAKAQLSVPVNISMHAAVPFEFTGRELRDSLQEGRFGKAAMQAVASKINQSVQSQIAMQATNVIKRTGAATGFDDIAQADSVFNETGVPSFDRVMTLTSRDYNSMAGDLAKRQTMQGKPTTAYEKAYVGTVSGFDTYKLDYNPRLDGNASATGITINTTTAGNNDYDPKATNLVQGELLNVDNRTQTITTTTNTALQVGDCFTIAGVYNVHQQSKQNSGQLKTFRVIAKPTATSLTISPPLITGRLSTEANKQYQNVAVDGTGSATAALAVLNTVSAGVNAFWQKEAVVLVPGTFEVPEYGIEVMTYTSDSGIQIKLSRQGDINDLSTKFRVDAYWGIGILDPEQTGIMLFNQT